MVLPHPCDDWKPVFWLKMIAGYMARPTDGTILRKTPRWFQKPDWTKRFEYMTTARREPKYGIIPGAMNVYSATRLKVDMLWALIPRSSIAISITMVRSITSFGRL